MPVPKGPDGVRDKPWRYSATLGLQSASVPEIREDWLVSRSVVSMMFVTFARRAVVNSVDAIT